MKKRIVATFLIILLCMLVAFPSHAYSKDEHTVVMREVLFGAGDSYYKSLKKDDERKIAIDALAAAVALSLDHFNGEQGNGKNSLKVLKDYGVNGLPPNLVDGKDAGGINYSANSRTHRQYTHKGWDYNYEKDSTGDIGNWSLRKKLLLNTTHKVFQDKNLFSRAWDKICSAVGFNGNEEQLESFCELMYYLHVLGDHIDSDKYEEGFTAVPFVEISGKGDTSIIQELKLCLESLFAEQVNEQAYIKLIKEIDTIKIEAERLLYNESGRLHNQDNYMKYIEYQKELLEILKESVPKLLKEEEFFYEKFYK